MYEPRVIGDIINEMLLSNEPLANAFCNWIAEREKTKSAEEKANSGLLFREFFPNTEPCIDLKLITRKQGRLEEGITLPGVITRDGEFHFTFKEVTSIFALVKRNPQVFCGDFITVTRRDDGTLRLNFRPKTMGPDFNAASYATDVANEILWALTGLLGK